MVSKELLSEMFGWDIKFVNPRVNDNEISFVEYNGNVDSFNVYYVAHKCKDWAFVKHDYIISSYNKGSESVATFYNKDFGVFCSETEPEAIFKACEYILKQLSNK